MVKMEKFSFISGLIEVIIIVTGRFDLEADTIKKYVVANFFGRSIKVATLE